MSTSQRAVTPCGWGAKAGMVQVRVAVKLCKPLVTHGPYLSTSEIGIKSAIKIHLHYFTFVLLSRTLITTD